jgi:RNA-directed DNA polymerase
MVATDSEQSSAPSFLAFIFNYLIISEIFSFQNFYQAYKSCLKGKGNKNSSLKFEERRESNLRKMSRELKDRTYEIGPFTCFAISEPKIREVWAADFRDRIIHHLLVAKIEPIWEKIFIHDSYACRTRKGAHRALEKIKRIFASNKNIYYLHLDIRGFFTSIDKEILFKIIIKKVKNPELVYLTKMIIFHDPKENYIMKGDRKLLISVPLHKSLFGQPPGKGLPIGNYTSQFFANVYLNELDQYVKRVLKCKYYFRYMDDMVILDNDQDRLRVLTKEIDKFLKTRLKIELHPKKTVLQKAAKGLNFLGYVGKPDYFLSRRRVVGNVKNKLRKINFDLKNAKDAEEIKSIVSHALCLVNSYWGHFKHGNCVSLKKKLYEKYFGELKEYLEPKNPAGEFITLKDYPAGLKA